MARLLFAFLLVATALIQATVLPRLNPTTVAPDLVLVFLFVWSMSRSLKEALFWVFFTGLLLDVLALDPFGTNALSLMGVAVFAGIAGQRRSNILFPIGLVVLATVMHGVLLGVLRGELPTGWLIPIQMLLHALLIPVMYIVLRVFDR